MRLLLNSANVFGMQILHRRDDKALDLYLGLAFGQILGVEWLVLVWDAALARALAEWDADPAVRVPR